MTKLSSSNIRPVLRSAFAADTRRASFRKSGEVNERLSFLLLSDSAAFFLFQSETLGRDFNVVGSVGVGSTSGKLFIEGDGEEKEYARARRGVSGRSLLESSSSTTGRVESERRDGIRMKIL